MEIDARALEEVASLAHGRVLLDHLRAADIWRGGEALTWVLPRDFLAEAAQLWGLPVLHADVPEPLLAVCMARPRPPIDP
jgi:hypothetical protein